MRLSSPALLVCLLTACGACGDDDPTGDSGAEDAGLDSGRDAGRDAGQPSDAGRDAGMDAGPDPGGWEEMPGFPSGCVIEQASRPEEIFAPRWESCGDGCERLLADEGWVRSFGTVGGHDGTRGYFAVVQQRLGHAERVVVLAATDGDPVAGWRGPSSAADGICSVWPVAISTDGAAAAVVASTFGAGWPSRERIYHGSLTSIGSETEPVATLEEALLPGESAIQALATSATTVAAEVRPAGFVAVVEDGVLQTYADPGSSPQNAQVVGSHVYWESWGDSVVVLQATIDEGPATYLEATDADVVGTAIGDGWLSWQRTTPPGGPYTASELWASSYQPDAGALEPAAVASLGGFYDWRTGGGAYAIRRVSGGPQRVELYDLETGDQRTFEMPDGWALLSAPLYVTEDEMLLSARKDGVATLFRVELASLPAG